MVIKRTPEVRTAAERLLIQLESVEDRLGNAIIALRGIQNDDGSPVGFLASCAETDYSRWLDVVRGYISELGRMMTPRASQTVDSTGDHLIGSTNDSCGCWTCRNSRM